MPVNNSLDYEEWFVGEVKRALEEAEAGQLVDRETVVKKWDRQRAADVKPTR
jgi:predicted transcriptional regulator